MSDLKTTTKNTDKQMRNRANALPRSQLRLDELLQQKEQANGQKPTNCMWVTAGTLAKLHFALARKREITGPEGDKWRKMRLRKNKMHDAEGSKSMWEIWLQDKNETEVHGIEELMQTLG